MAPGDGNFEDDIEALDTALGELRENGLDAESDELSDALAVFETLTDEAKEGGYERGDEAETDELWETADSLERLIDGEAAEEDVVTAEEGIETVGQGMVQVALKQSLGL